MGLNQFFLFVLILSLGDLATAYNDAASPERVPVGAFGDEIEDQKSRRRFPKKKYNCLDIVKSNCKLPDQQEYLDSLFRQSHLDRAIQSPFTQSASLCQPVKDHLEAIGEHEILLSTCKALGRPQCGKNVEKGRKKKAEGLFKNQTKSFESRIKTLKGEDVNKYSELKKRVCPGPTSHTS